MTVLTSARNVSTGGALGETVLVSPNDTVEIIVQISSSDTAHSVRAIQELPFGMSYISGSSTLNGNVTRDDIIGSGLFLNDLLSGQTATIKFRAWISGAGAFVSGIAAMPSTTTVTAINSATMTDSVFVNVMNIPTGLIIDVGVVGRNVTRGETSFQEHVNASPGDTIEFKSTLTSLVEEGDEIDEIDANIFNILPPIMTYVQGSTAVDGVTVADTTAPNVSITLTDLAAGQEAVITFQGKVNSSDSIEAGIHPVINTLQVQTEMSEPLIIQFPITVYNGGIAGAGDVPTGNAMNAIVVAILISAAVTFMYVAYTRTSMFNLRELHSLVKKRMLKGVDTDFKR
jgi:hypothetical protein